MYSFFISLVVLIGGYFVYGAFVEKVFNVDSKKQTPAYRLGDGVDYVPLPTWKVFLIQFLNIAGLGPIFGAIMASQQEKPTNSKQVFSKYRKLQQTTIDQSLQIYQMLRT